jgi:MFS transporter, DHA2 family, glioxin efflux transporter
MNLGGITIITAAQSAFFNTMVNNLLNTAAGIDQITVVYTGATELRHMFPTAEVPRIVAAYMNGIKGALDIIIGATSLPLVVASFAKWANWEKWRESKQKGQFENYNKAVIRHWISVSNYVTRTF